jgi:hypothetical protein
MSVRPPLALSLLALLAARPCACGADTLPWADGDAARGATLVQRDCDACHARRFDGDPARIYVRDDRKVRTPAQLVTQITYCSTELNTGYFPDEEAHVAAYLDTRYYHFGGKR